MSKSNDIKERRRHPILINILIIIVIAFLGLWIVYIAAALFTKHGEEQVVPKVENMSYTKAIELLHSYGLNVDIRDSLYRDDIKPGFVIEQFPKANSIVKPGRKIFLYINAVHPKEVIIDDNHDRTALAMKGMSYRQGFSRLHELGFKEIETITVLGLDDRIVKILANGKPVYQMQKVPVNAKITIEVSDGRLTAVRDSLFESERIGDFIYDEPELDASQYSAPTYKHNYNSQPSSNGNAGPTYFEMPQMEESPASEGGNSGTEQNSEFFD